MWVIPPFCNRSVRVEYHQDLQSMPKLKITKSISFSIIFKFFYYTQLCMMTLVLVFQFQWCGGFDFLGFQESISDLF